MNKPSPTKKPSNNRSSTSARKIAAQKSAADAAQAGVHNARTGVRTAGSSIDVAKAAVVRAQAAATLAADAQLKLATNNYHRIEPLLKKQYVTVEQIAPGKYRHERRPGQL